MLLLVIWQRSLNPFVQVFYSNHVVYIDELIKNGGGLNPFVQVFYSNLEEVQECLDKLPYKS